MRRTSAPAPCESAGKATCLALALACLTAHAGDNSDVLKQLQEQNKKLQGQLDQQKKIIEQLQQSVRQLGDKEKETAENTPADALAKGLLSKPFSSSNIILSGEGGVGFFEQPPHGQFPKSEFRIDEAKLFFDVKLWEDVYLFTEVNITEREAYDNSIYVGELYLDFENLLPKWGERWLNVRAGRFYIPFGEEYTNRRAIDNPLVSHSLSDLWGVDEGVELFGKIADKWRYALAVQNGGNPMLHDYTSDKSVAGRVSYDLKPWLGFSLSGMRTGDVDPGEDRDQFSAMWFGNGFFKAISPAATLFHADLVEGDVKFTLPRGSVKGAGGFVHSSDNSPVHNPRDVYYYFVEGVGDVTSQFYLAARVSQIFADGGFPLVGGGDFGERMYGPLTDELWRFSIGAGYHWSKNLLLKAEYSFNGGHTVNGVSRSQENLIGAEIAFRF